MSEIAQTPATQIDPDDLENNTSNSPSLHDVMAARMHRRYVLKGGVGAMTMAGLGTLGLSACGGGGGDSAAPDAPARPLLNFAAVNKATTDRITVPAGYTATVIYATGDPIDAAVSDYKNDGTDSDFARRSGDHHDGMHFFGLSAAGAPDITSNDRALLVHAPKPRPSRRSRHMAFPLLSCAKRLANTVMSSHRPPTAASPVLH